jgi:DNA processing protein
MALTTVQTLACLQLMGKDEVLALGTYAQQNNITLQSSPKALWEFFNLCANKNVINSISLATMQRYKQEVKTAALKYKNEDCSNLCFEDKWALLQEHINPEILFCIVPDINEIAQAINTARRILDISNEDGIRTVSYFDALFPPMLKMIRQSGKNVCPVLLYYKGDIALLQDSIGIALIGTRQPTPEGVNMGRYLGKVFAEEGMNIVSGLAFGCDAAAHRGAIDAQGLTTAFVAHGLDTVYPKEHTELAKQIFDNGGLIISEYPIGTPCSGNNLVERCRLQASLADATVVIQTPVKKGGSMHAVRISIDNGKPVFAVQYDKAMLSNHKGIGGNMKLLREKKAQPLHKDNVQDVIGIIVKSVN